MGKGKLLYETPADSVRSRVLAIAFHLFLVVLGILFSFLMVLFIVLFVVVVIYSILTLQPVDLNPTGGGLFEVKRYRFAALHRRVRVYENGITRPLDELRSLTHKEEEGEFIPFSRVLAFETGEIGRQCYITIEELKDGRIRHSTIVYKDKRAGVMSELCNHLKACGVHRLPKKCLKCGKKCEFDSWRCRYCDRFMAPRQVLNLETKDREKKARIPGFSARPSVLEEVIQGYEQEEK